MSPSASESVVVMVWVPVAKVPVVVMTPLVEMERPLAEAAT